MKEATPKTPAEAASLLAKKGDFGAMVSYLGAIPLEDRSKLTTSLVLDLAAKSPETLKKLAKTDGVFQSVLVFMGTKPYDEANLTKAIPALMTAREPPGAVPAAAKPTPAAGGWAAAGASKPVTYSGRPQYPADTAMPEGLAQPLSSGSKRYGSEFNGSGEVNTGGRFGNRSVNVICDYEVSVRNPKSGQVERVLFEGIQQARKAPWGLSTWYDTAKDVDSKVLACEGHVYGPKELKYNMSGKGPLEQWMSGAIEQTSAFAYQTIPELAQRVEQFKKTGETGNDTGKKRGR